MFRIHRSLGIAAVLLFTFAVGCASGGSDVPTACRDSLTRCASGCVNLAMDPTNCGSCAIACSPSQVCSAGACALTCGGGATHCGDHCVDTQVDPANCGGCGSPCSASQVCTMGACRSAPCADSLTSCPSGTSTLCVDTQSDNANCGFCGNACVGGQACAGGLCSLTCGALASCSSKTGGAPYCANTQTDNANCGGCGMACGSGMVCAQGHCAITCGTLATCAPDAGMSYCANMQSDNANCGACGNSCASGQMCASGECSLTCGALTTCTTDPKAQYCANTDTDNANCGGCGVACGGDSKCAGGQCLAPVLWSDVFVGGAASTAQQCTTWNNFRGNLTIARVPTLTGMKIYGSALPTPITCTDPVATRTFADALRTLTSTMVTCDGHTWSLCGSRYSGEVWLDAPALCSSANCPSPGNIIRPCITATVWGGFNSNTCGAATQSMALELD